MLEEILWCRAATMADDLKHHMLLCLKPKLNDLNECMPGVLNAVDHLQLFALQKTSQLNDIVGHVHSCLGSVKTRVTGLLLLKQLLEQCPTPVFTQNLHTWLGLLLPALQGHDSAETLQLACSVLNLLLEAVTEFPELSRHVASDMVSKLVPALLSNSPEWRDAAFGSLCCLIINFGGATGQHRGKVKAAVLEEMKQASPCKNAIRCYGLLHRCGNAGNRGINHEAMFEELCQETLNTLHSLLSHLYQGFETDEATNSRQKEEELAHPDSFEAQCHLVSQFENFCQGLCALLSEAGRYPVTVSVSGILSVVFRCLRVKGDTLMRVVSTERLLLLSLLPSLHLSSLRILSQLLTCCAGSLFHIAASIWELLLDGLCWTRVDSQTYGSTPAFHRLREGLYRLAAQWLESMREGAGLFPELILTLGKEIQHDITPVADTINKANGQAAEGPPRKKRKGHMLLEMSSQRKINRAANSPTVIQALAAMAALVKAVGPTEPGCLLAVCESLVQVVDSVQNSPWSPPLPYGVAACRLALYQALQAFSLYPVNMQTCSRAVLYQRLRTGLRDHDPEVRHFCQDAMVIVEGHLHPRQPPSLHRTSKVPAVPAAHKESQPRRNAFAWSKIAQASDARMDTTDCSAVSKRLGDSDLGILPSSSSRTAPAWEESGSAGAPKRSKGLAAEREEERSDSDSSSLKGAGRKQQKEQVQQSSEDSEEDMDPGGCGRKFFEATQEQQQLLHQDDSPSASPQHESSSEEMPSTSKTSQPPEPEPTASNDDTDRGGPGTETDCDLSSMLQDFHDSDPEPE